APSQAEWARREAEEAADDAVRAAERTPRPGRTSATSAEPIRRIVAPPAAPSAAAALTTADTSEILVVVSKLKKYVKERSGMNTSDGVVQALSDHLRDVCDRAIRKAGEDGRKTVLDRDVRAILR